MGPFRPLDFLQLEEELSEGLKEPEVSVAADTSLDEARVQKFYEKVM